jgi:hypothetical protein
MQADRDGSNARDLWDGVPGKQVYAITVAADGTRLAATLASTGPDGSYVFEIWGLNPDGSGAHKIVASYAPSFRPS